MKKLLLLFLLMPLLAIAQKDAPILRDFAKKTLGLVYSVKLNTQAYVSVIITDEDNFELAAVNDNMQELWRTPLKGLPGGLGLFKGNILAYGVTTRGKEEIHTGYLIDGKTGKTLAQKVIYDSNAQFMEQVMPVFNEQGSIAKLIVRESGSKRTSFKNEPYRDTKDLTIIDVNEKLETTSSKPAIPSGGFIAFRCNQQGDLFILTTPADNALQLSKFEAGKSAPATEITQNIDLRNKTDIYGSYFALSNTDNNAAYTALIHDNKAKDHVLTLCRFDFGTKSARVASTPFDKQHIKGLEKSFVPLYKKMPEPEFGNVDTRSVDHLEEYNGNLIVSIAGGLTGSHQLGAIGAMPNAANTVNTLESFALIIAGFDLKLQPKFEQVLPVYYQYIEFLQNSYHADGNYYDILASNTRHDRGAYYARIDVTNGKLVKFDLLTIDGKHLLNTNALWFSNNFLVPLSYLTGVLPPHKISVDLLQATY